MKNHDISIEQVNQILPQTQCRDCGYSGCRPYAQAIIEDGAPVDRCLPGGVETLTALGKLLQQDITPYRAAMQQRQKPAAVVRIQEDLCIGCTKCIQACPVDAIIGGAKLMHSVISAECTGCQLCIEPCPMDCIDLIPEPALLTPVTKQARADHAYDRYQARTQRLTQLAEEKHQQHQQHQQAGQHTQSKTDVVAARKAYIAAAIARVNAKRQTTEPSATTKDTGHE